MTLERRFWKEMCLDHLLHELLGSPQLAAAPGEQVDDRSLEAAAQRGQLLDSQRSLLNCSHWSHCSHCLLDAIRTVRCSQISRQCSVTPNRSLQLPSLCQRLGCHWRASSLFVRGERATCSPASMLAPGHPVRTRVSKDRHSGKPAAPPHPLSASSRVVGF